MKVVINKCYGGFGLSDEAYLELAKSGVPIRAYVEQERDPVTRLYKPQPVNQGEVIFDTQLSPKKSWSSGQRYWCTGWIARNDSRLVALVEKLGPAANGRYAKLEVVEIPDGIQWQIDEYDGMEQIS